MALDKAQLILSAQQIKNEPDLDKRQVLLDKFNQDVSDHLQSVNIPENNEYVQGIYEGVKKLSVLAKPIAHITTPITELARVPFKELAEIRGNSETPKVDIAAEWKTGDLYPSDRFGTSLLAQDIVNAVGGKNEPLAKISSKNWPQAANVAQNLTVPANIAGVAGDVLMGKAMGPVAGMIGKNSNRISLETAKNYIRAISKNKELLQQLEETGKINEVAEMVANNPEKYLHQFKPNAVYEQLRGPIQKGYSIEDYNNYNRPGTGDISKAVNTQKEFIDEIPTDHYVVDMPEMRIQALNNVPTKGYEVNQIESAKNFVKSNIPVMQPDEGKLSRINKLGELSSEYKNIRDTLPDNIPNPNYREDLQWLSKLPSESESFQKSVPNPNYREDLQWLSKLPVAEDGENVFPKNYETHNITTETPEFDPYRINSYTDPNKINKTTSNFDILSESQKETSGFKNKKLLDIANGKQNEPRFVNKPDDGFSTTQKRIDIMQGKHLEPQTIPNQQKITRLAEIEQQMKDLGVADPLSASPEAYMEWIRQQNERPAGYTSELRQLGNKMMEPPTPGEISTDLQAKNIAGRAIEKAASEAQSVAMSGLPQNTLDLYHYNNKKLSAMLNLEELMKGNLSSREYIKPPTGNMGGATGNVGFFEKNLNQYIRPTLAEGSNYVMNTARDTGRGYINSLPVIDPLSSIAMKKGLVSNLADYQIPRDSNKILENKQAVLAKVAQVTNDPNLLAMLDDALNRYPEKLETVLPALVMQFPNLFEPDIYGRVNNKVLDPILRQKAYQDVINSGLSNTQKAFLQNGLNKDGTLPKEMFK